MKKILAAAAMAVSAVLAPATASAGPLYTLYQFQVQSWSCSNGEASSCGGNYGPAQFSMLNVGIINGFGTLNVETLWAVYPTVGGGPFEYDNIAIADFGSTGTPLDFATEKCMSSWLCYVRASFVADGTSSFLTGFFSSGNEADTIYMASNGTSIWEGYYLSDNGTSSDRHPVFSGVWIAVPEPATLALFGAGLAGLIGMRRRKAA